MRNASPLLVRMTVVAELIGCSSATLRRVARQNAVTVRRLDADAGPQYVTPRDAARLAWLVMGSRVDNAWECRLRREAKSQADALGPRRERTGPERGGVPE